MSKEKLPRFAPLALLLLFAIVLYLVLFYAPPEKELGNVYRIIYFHLPAAWITYIAFTITTVASILLLARRRYSYDIYAHTSAKLGLIFCGLTLVSGSIFAKHTWGSYWNWDPRETATLVLWFVYAAYLQLRSAIEDLEKRAVVSAIMAIFGALAVVFSYISARVFFSLHPIMFGRKGGGMSQEMLVVLIVSLIFWAALFAYLFWLDMKLRKVSERISLLERRSQ